MVYADTSTLSNAFWRSLQSIKDSFTSIDRFEIQLSGELREMRDERLFVEGGHKSFEEFCNKELSQWGGYRRVNQLLGFGQVAEVLRGTELDGVVNKESHARPVLRLVSTPEKLKEAVAIASQQSPNPTARDFREAAEKVVPIARKTKSQEQLFLTGAKVRVVCNGHPRDGHEGEVSGDPNNHTHLFIVFPDAEGSELIAIKDLDAPSSSFVARRYPKEYEEAIAQLKQQHEEEMRRLESEVRSGLLTEVENQARQLVREQLETSQAIASSKAKEVAKLQQKIDELESLRTLEVENQQLYQRIGELERALENLPVQEWGNTFTKQAQKILNAEVVKMVENREPELHLRSLACSPPSDAAEAMQLMGLAMGNLAKALNDTQALSAAAILLKCNPTPEAVEKAVMVGQGRAAQSERDSKIEQAIADIRKAIEDGCNWDGFWAIASNYLDVKDSYWPLLTIDERSLIKTLKKDFDAAKAAPAVESSPWLLTPQSWQSGGRSCKYLRMGKLSLLFNDEKWVAITPPDQEKYINPRTWLDWWEQGNAIEGAIAHTDINKAAYEFHGTIEGVNPDLQEVRVLWEEIPDARWYGVHELRVREEK